MARLRDDPPFEDELLLQGETRRVVADIHHFFSKERLEQGAMREERLRLARELHDGLLQTLGSVGLQLEVLARTVDSDPEGARVGLRALRELLGDEQRELRRWVETLSLQSTAANASAADLAAALQRLAHHAEAQWNLRVVFSLNAVAGLPRTLGDHVYRIVQEALANVGRHARARTARVDTAIRAERIDLAISDDGIGYPYHGTFDLPTMVARGIGPRSLKERVAALQGDLVLATDASGTRLLASVPRTRFPWPARHAAAAARYGHD
jgi:signal transduction histidine kinase